MKGMTTLLTALLLATVAVAQVASPLRLSPRGVSEWGTHLDFNAQAYAAIRASEGRELIVAGFPLDSGRSVNLRLERFTVFSPGTRIVVASPEGERPLPLPDVVLLRGTIEDEPGTEVYLGLSPAGCDGWIRRSDEMLVISSGDFGTTVYNVTASPPQAPSNWACRVLQPPVVPIGEGRVRTASGGSRTAAIAVETDEEFLDKFGTPTNAASYVARLYGAQTTIYERDLQTKLVVTYLRLWEGTDPWDQGNTGDQLTQFRNYWVTHMGYVPRALAHYLSPRGLGGGVAWLSVVCNYSWGFGLSSHIAGTFHPNLIPHGSNWDPFVVAHEMGHNFGTLHTHDGYSPPIDTCGLGCNDPPFDGTIMSYCHGCPGGMWNIHLEFHPRVIERINTYLDYESICDLTETEIRGTVHLREYEGGPGISGLVIARDTVTGDPVVTDFPSLDAQERFTMRRVPAGTFDVEIIWPNWLKKLLPGAALPAPVAELSVTLFNGDADYNNFVNLGDANVVLANYGKTTYMGDLNWDGVVNLRDLNIILLNFGLMGDP